MVLRCPQEQLGWQGAVGMHSTNLSVPQGSKLSASSASGAPRKESSR